MQSYILSPEKITLLSTPQAVETTLLRHTLRKIVKATAPVPSGKSFTRITFSSDPTKWGYSRVGSIGEPYNPIYSTNRFGRIHYRQNITHHFCLSPHFHDLSGGFHIGTPIILGAQVIPDLAPGHTALYIACCNLSQIFSENWSVKTFKNCENSDHTATYIACNHPLLCDADGIISQDILISSFPYTPARLEKTRKDLFKLIASATTRHMS